MRDLTRYLVELGEDPFAQQTFADDPDAALRQSDLESADREALAHRDHGALEAAYGWGPQPAPRIFGDPGPDPYPDPDPPAPGG